MNKIYKVIWSKTRNCYVAVSELAKTHSKGCSGRRIGRLLTVGAVVAGLMLPMGDAGAFSSSFIEQYARYDDYSEDFMTNGGTIFGDYIGQYYANGGSNGVPYLFINNDGSIEYTKGEGVQRRDISTQVGNVAIGNFASASQGPNYRYLRTYNSVRPAFETAPSSDYNYTYNYNGKTYYYKSGYDNTYNISYDIIKVGEKVYLPYYGYPIYDDNGNYMGSETRYTEVGKDIWKVDPDNPGRLVYDYKNVDETTRQPIYDKNWDNLGIEMGGTNNVAVGNKAKTTHHSSVAVGDTSTARGWRSIAIGAESEAGADPETTYIGSWNDGTSAVAVGNSAKAYGSTSVAVGNGAQTYSFSGVAVGNGANASSAYGIAIGDNARIAYINNADSHTTQRAAEQSIAIGRDAVAQAKDATAVGRNSNAMMRNATAYGNNAHANAWNSIAIGNKATAGIAAEIFEGDKYNGVLKPEAEVKNDDGSITAIGNSAIAIGNRARATAEYTTAIGAGTNAEGWHAVAVGDSNQATGRFSTAIGAGWSINHTEGEPDSDDATDGSDAINTEGTRTYESIGANQAGGDYSTAAGYGNKTVGTQSSAFGKENEVSGVSSLGVGAGNKVGTVAVGDNGILDETQENSVSGYAVGSYNTITGSEGSNAGAFGAGNTVAGDNSYAAGNSNTIGEDSANSFVIGNHVTTTKAGTVVVGHHDPEEKDNTTVDGANGTAPTFTFGKNSVSLGTNAAAQAEDSVALGSYSISNRAAGSAGAGYDVSTGLSYDGRDKGSPTWTSTLGAVSVGVDKTDGSVGSAAVETRQITGVAAGTADTDAVNVAQLKLIRSHYYSVNVDTGDQADGEDSNYDNLGATGAGSLAAGFYTIASGDQSVSTGYKAMAASSNSTAYGVDSTSVGKGSIAIGHVATSGALVSVVPDNPENEGTTEATYKTEIISVNKQNEQGQSEYYVFRNLKEKDKDGKTEVVAYNTATGDYYSTTPDGKGSYDIGAKRNDITEGEAAEGKKQVNMGGIAMGSYAHAEGDRSLAMGRASGAYGENSSALGIYANAVGDGDLAIGHGSSTGVKAEVVPSGDEGTAERADGFWTTSFKDKDGNPLVDQNGNKTIDDNGNPVSNRATGGIAIGSYAHTEGTRALAVGRVASAYGTNSTAIGLRSSAYGEGSIAFGHGVVAGDEEHPYNEQVPALHNDPTIEYDLDGSDNIVDPNNVIGAVAMGSYAKATGRGSLSVGRYSEANSAYSTAMGIRAKVDKTATNAVAIGREVSVGEGGENSVAIGKQSTVTGKDSIAIGTGHTVSGDNSGAFGDPTVIDAKNSYSVGNNNEIKGDDTFVMGNNVKTTGKNTVVIGSHAKDNTDTFGENSVSLGTDATASVADGVALGSGSVASRDKANGGAGAGFDVTTGTNYAGEGSDSATWTSTLAAVSVGGDSKDGSIGAAATATRQITGVAAGTADTDAVNVAQLKLAMGAKNYTEGTNVTIDENNVINATDTTYQFNTEDGDPDTNLVSTTTVNSSTDGKNYDTKVGEFNDTDTKITNITVNAGDKDDTGNIPYTITLNDNGDNKEGSSNLTATFKLPTYNAEQSVNAGDNWGTGDTTFNLKDSNGGDAGTMSLKAGDNVKITKGDNGEAVIQGNGLKNDENKVEYDENGEGSVTITDQAGNTTTITGIQSGGGEGVADSINYLGNKINNLDKKINKVGAGAAALAGLHPLDFDPDEKWHVAAGVGSYGNETAVALGAFYQPTDDVLFNVATTLGDGRNMVSGGVSIRFGQKSHQSRSKKAMAKEIIELREEVAELKALVYDLTGKGGLDPSKTAIFPDTPENHWAYDYVAVLAGNGVLEGYQDGYFKGNRQLTRYEMAAIIYRLMSKGIEVDNRMLQEFAPELARVKVDTLTHYGDGTPHIQRVRIIPQRG